MREARAGWPEVTAHRAGDLAAGHLEAFIWRFAHRVPGLSLQTTLSGTRLETHSRSSCRQIWRVIDAGPRLGAVAVPDLDGIFHLVGKHSECSHRCQRLADPRYATDPSQVPRAAQCPTAVRAWPAYLGPGARMTTVKREIAHAAGGVCSLCRSRPCQLLDHDHLTGTVRGYLCRVCNTQVDACLHPAGCPSHDYLVDPPLAHLGQQHPHHTRFTRLPTYQDRMNHYQQVMAGGASAPVLDPDDDWGPGMLRE